MDDLQQKTALVTGAGRGIGRAIALALARAGAYVAANFRSDRAAAESLIQEILDSGGQGIALRADVGDPAQVEHLVAQAEAEFGPVAILVNNAGMARPQPVEQITLQDWNELIRVNLTSCFLLTQRVLPEMRARRWGRIINISSVAAHVGGAVGPHYAASKAGMLGLTHSYAALLAKEGITANAIAPALVDTDMVRANPNVKRDLIPVGRFGDVGEVADIAVLLARNGYITGQTIHVNGGWYLT